MSVSHSHEGAFLTETTIWASPSEDEHGDEYRDQLQLILWQQNGHNDEVEDVEE